MNMTITAILSIAAAVTLSGCELPGKVTGGGWIASTSGVSGDKANFGFNGQQCDKSQPAKGHFNYHDQNAPGFPGGVKMNGPVVEAGLCTNVYTYAPPYCSFCKAGEYEVQFDYRSTNPNFTGEGAGVACAADNGEGINTTDTIGLIYVSSGPFTGYHNSGQVQGNIQAHSCDE